MFTGKRLRLIDCLWTTRGCGILSAIFVLGESKPEKEIIATIEKRVEARVREHFR
jgi:hypothetical protein